MVVALVEARLVDEVLLALGAERAAPVPPVFVAVELVVVHAGQARGGLVSSPSIVVHKELLSDFASGEGASSSAREAPSSGREDSQQQKG
eukprot:3037200-Pyramimonas_sp.AAC.1